MPRNEGPLDRALRIIEAAGEVSREEAARLHRDAGGEVKTAIVMARRGLGAAAARRLLDAAGGHVRLAVEADRGEAEAPTERPLG